MIIGMLNNSGRNETVQNFVRDAFSYAIGKRSSNMMAS